MTSDTAGDRLAGRRAPLLVAAVVTALVLLAACSGGGGGEVAGGDDPPTEGSGPASSDPASTATTPTSLRSVPTPRTGPLTTPPSVRPVDAYLPGGIRDQIFPPDTDAMALLAAGRCGPLLREIQEKWDGMPPSLTLLYQAAAQACLSKWKEATADHGRIDTTKICNKDDENNTGWDSSFATQEECFAVRMQVYKWTFALLAARRADPRFVPNFPSPPTP